MKEDLHICIMAGGAGTRFWPMSTEEKPKQFIDVLNVGRTLLQMTYDRALQLVPSTHIWIMTNAKYYNLVQAQLPELSKNNILLEPQRKNTAPAIAYAAVKLRAVNEQAIMVVLSSDHVIQKEKEFLACLNIGVNQVVDKDAIVTLGIQPTQPHTGYGYIQFEKSDEEAKKVLRFVEKPNAPTAAGYISEGNYLWNAGIFIWRCSKVLKELSSHAKDIFEIFDTFGQSIGSPEENTALMVAFDQCRSESIDYAVMEKAEMVYTVPADIGWSDLGTWGSLHEMIREDSANHNTIHAGNQAVIEEVKDTIIRLPENRKAMIRGLDGFIVAWEEEGLLIYPLKEEQFIKQSLQKLT